MSSWDSLVRQAAERLGPVAGSVARREAETLACHIARRNRAWLLAHGPDAVPADSEGLFQELLTRRAAGDPLPYVIGSQEFYGLSFRVTPATLIPRPETELLVERFLALEPDIPAGSIADIGTGSGCILGACLTHCRRAGIATDISADALAVAASNWRALGLAGRAFPVLGDFLSPLRPASLAAILCNPPYVAPGDPRLDPAVARYEPAVALYSGDDGLAATRQVISGAPATLLPGGVLLLEIGIGQADAVATLLAGWRDVAITPDLAGIPRLATAQR
jgi:release factor glutamine methyltransferase